MSETDIEKPSAPTMQRTKIQLETSYSPGALFTFENSLVVCESLPKREYREAKISQYAESQILLSVEERIQYWFQAAMRAENSPEPFMCVEGSLLSEDERTLGESIGRSMFAFAEPTEMGYCPALLSFACSRCKRAKFFRSLNELDKRKAELSPGYCTSRDGTGECHWKQMDIVFVHPNGNYQAPLPWLNDYSSYKNTVIRRHLDCPRCGETEVRIENKSQRIGQRYFYCANETCGMKRGNDDRWLQNDSEWLERFGEESYKRIEDVRMKATSYRSNAVHYPLQDMIIDFGKSEKLKALNDPTGNAVIEEVANRFDVEFIEPDEKQLEKDVVNARGEQGWRIYERAKKHLSRLKTQFSGDDLDDDDRAFYEDMSSSQIGKIESIKKDWREAGLYPATAKLPPRLVANAEQRSDRFSSRFDPFRLLVEHATLRERIVSDKLMENGLSHFTPMDMLDEYIGPDTNEERMALNQEHRVIMDGLGVSEMGLARRFETIQYSFGYTRVASTPTTTYINQKVVPVRLRLFPKTAIEEERRHPIFVLRQNNEAIYVKLDEQAVRRWLMSINTQEQLSSEAIGLQYLTHVPPMDHFLETLPNPESPSLPLAIYTLLHTFAHHVMMGVSEFSGLGVGSLGEYIFPADLAFVVYRRGMTMDLGNLTSMIRNNAPAFLKYLESPRNLACGSGSLCYARGGACPDCLLVPEVSCLTQNKLLSRTVLIGKDHPKEGGFRSTIAGYFDVAKSLQIT